MYERLDNCPLCNSGHFHNKIITKDYSVSGESFAIVECDKCGFNFTNPRPSPEEIGSFYESQNYISHKDKSHSIFDIVYRIVRRFTISSKVRLIEGLDTKKTILDYGCGTGEFLKAFKLRDWEISGIEPNPGARTIAEKNTDHTIYEKAEDLPANQQYHIITLWHVLEHIHDLQETIKMLKERVKKKGFIIIALPNNKSWDLEYYKEFWAAYDVPRHLYHFNPETLKKLAKEHKLKVKQIIPMKFDAFYISLLSEKYKNNKNNAFKALINGLKSNRSARKNNQYSSLIYILRR